MNSQNIDVLIAQLHELSSDEPDNQFKAAIALGDMTDANARNRVVDELIKALGLEHQALTRAHAAEALGKLGDPKAALPLIDALKDDYQLVRSYGARALGKLGDTAAIYPLIPILDEDKFFGARAEAAEALGKLGKLCKDNNTKDSIKEALNRHFEKEKQRLEHKEVDERSRRVLAEIERSLEQIKVIINKLIEALAQKRYEDTKSLAQMGIIEVENMGQIFRR